MGHIFPSAPFSIFPSVPISALLHSSALFCSLFLLAFFLLLVYLRQHGCLFLCLTPLVFLALQLIGPGYIGAMRIFFPMMGLRLLVNLTLILY